MDYTQADVDSLTDKLSRLTDGEKAALAAAIEEIASEDVGGFALNAYLSLSLGGQKLLGTTYGGDGIAPGKDAGTQIRTP